jgi:sec-independent protein translocase protein TatA
MEALSIPHLLIILVIVLVFFGGRRIPDVMKGLGQGIREFKEGMRGDTPVQPNSTSSAQAQQPPVPTPTEEKKL